MMNDIVPLRVTSTYLSSPARVDYDCAPLLQLDGSPDGDGFQPASTVQVHNHADVC